MPLRYQTRYKLGSGFSAPYLISVPCSCEEILELAALVIENQVDARPGEPRPEAEPRVKKDKLYVIDDTGVITELGIWCSGLESFLAAGHYSFVDADGPQSDATKEFRLVHSALLRCAGLNSKLLSIRSHREQPDSVTGRELSDLSIAFRDSILIGDCMIRSGSLGSAEWKAWSNSLNDRLTRLPVFRKLIRSAEASGEQCLPEYLRKIIDTHSADPEQADLALILPRFGKILKWLSVVGKMLAADEPLKPALLIFSSVNEQVRELVGYINNRLERFPNEEAELFLTLDAASYTASIELKKVYTQELAGLASLRPSPTIYARMETSYSLLNEGFQQMLAGFARLVDPKIKNVDLFPTFKIKFEQSVVLRKELWSLAQLVKAAEIDPAPQKIETLQRSLREFMKETVRFLFYKDTETVERFVEEILVTKQNKDLVPILHRFGAYLETLFAQVNLRAVLEKHPFQSGN